MKEALILTAILYSCISGSAQNESTTPAASESNTSKWKISQINGRISGGLDLFSNLNKNWIADHADFSEENEDWQTTLIPDNHNATSNGGCSNYGLYFTLEQGSKSQTEKRVRSNLQFGMKVRDTKSTAIHRSTSFDFGEYTSVSNEVHRISDREVDLSAAYLLSTDWKFLSVYAGALVELGTNFNGEYQIHSTSYNYLNSDLDEMMIDGDILSIKETYDTKQRLFSRLLVPVGVQFKPLGPISLDFGYQIGAGLDKVLGGQTHIIQQTQVFEVGISYHM